MPRPLGAKQPTNNFSSSIILHSLAFAHYQITLLDFCWQPSGPSHPSTTTSRSSAFQVGGMAYHIICKKTHPLSTLSFNFMMATRRLFTATFIICALAMLTNQKFGHWTQRLSHVFISAPKSSFHLHWKEYWNPIIQPHVDLYFLECLLRYQTSL